MLSRCATAAANDARACVERHAGVVGHDLGRAVVANRAVHVLGNAAVALGHQHHLGAHGFGQVVDTGHHLRGAHAAVGAAGGQAGAQRLLDTREVAGRDAHHGAAIGVKAQGADDGQVRHGSTGHGGFDLFARRHGLNPQHVGAASGQRQRLFGKGGLGLFKGQRSNGLHDFAGGAHAAGDSHGAAAGVGHLAGDLRGTGIEFCHAALGVVQLKAVNRAAKAVGQNDVGARVYKVLVQLGDALGVLGVPQLGRVARHQAHVKQVAAGGAIGQKPGACGQQMGKAVARCVLGRRRN